MSAATQVPEVPNRDDVVLYDPTRVSPPFPGFPNVIQGSIAIFSQLVPLCMIVHMSIGARIDNRIGEFNTRKSRKLWELWPPRMEHRDWPESRDNGF